MKRILTMLFIVISCLAFTFVLQGCESEQARLEKERTKLEIEKLKRDAEEETARKKAHDEFFKTDKLKNYKSQADPF